MKWEKRDGKGEWWVLRESVPEGFSPVICTVLHLLNNPAKPRRRLWKVYGMGNTTRCFSTKERAMQAADLYFLEKELDK